MLSEDSKQGYGDPPISGQLTRQSTKHKSQKTGYLLK